MAVRSWLAALALSTLAIASGCGVEPVSLGDNVDPELDSGLTAPAAPIDAGPGPTAPADGGRDDASALCLKNPTFAGAEAGALGGGLRSSPKVPDWQVCGGDVDVDPGFCTLPAPSGTTAYLGLRVGYAAFPYDSASVSTDLPATLPPGTYSFSVELAVVDSTLLQGGFGMAGDAPVELVVYGSATPCGRDQVLSRTTSITNMDTWGTYSIALTADQPFSNLVLVPTPTPPASPGKAGSYVVIGNIVSSPSCP
jgi:hypothetical protein